MKTLTATEQKKKFKTLTPDDVQLLQEKITQAGNDIFYQEAGRAPNGDRKYRLYLVTENGNAVKRGSARLEDVTYLLSNLIGDRFNKHDGTIRCYAPIQQWQRMLEDKLDRDLRSHITFLSVY